MPGPFASDHHRERVLIVAPNEDARSMLAFLLRAEGFNVYCLADAARARRLLRLCRGPVTVVLDESVPAGERAPWFHLLSALAPVRGVVLSQRTVASWTAHVPRGTQGGLPCVAVGRPLRIAALLQAIATVAARAEGGDQGDQADQVERAQTGAPRRWASPSQGGSGSAPSARP